MASARGTSMRADTISVNVMARVEKFQKGMREASRAVSDFARRVAKSVTVIAAGSAAGIAALTRSTANAVDRIAKLGRTFGVTSTEMATFELLAGRSGVALEQFARGSRNVAALRFDALKAFAEGKNSQAIDTFERLGVSMQELGRLNDPFALLQRVADALKAIPDGADKAAIQLKLLGGRAAEMVNALTEGSQGLVDARKHAIDFGLAVGQYGADATERFNDRVGDIGNVLEGARRQFVSGLAPALEAFTIKIRDAFHGAFGGPGGVQESVGGFVRMTVHGMLWVVDVVRAAINWFRGLADALRPVGESLRNVYEGAIKPVIEGMRDAVQSGIDFVSGAGQGQQLRFPAPLSSAETVSGAMSNRDQIRAAEESRYQDWRAKILQSVETSIAANEALVEQTKRVEKQERAPKSDFERYESLRRQEQLLSKIVDELTGIRRSKNVLSLQ